MQTAFVSEMPSFQPSLMTGAMTDTVSAPPPPKRKMSLMMDTNQLVREMKPPSTSNVSFEACGIFFKARHVPDGENARLVIWGSLGYLPYTVSSAQKRQNLISILEATHRLSHVKFGIDKNMKILVTGEYKIATPPAPDYLFVPLVRFLEEALPFIRLVGEHL